MTTITHWYTIQTKPRQEQVAKQNLHRQGFTTYLPLIHHRKRRRNQWTQVTEPLFPRYLFIQANPTQQSLAPIRSTLGVSQLVRFGHHIHPVPDEVIAYLQQAENTQTGQREDTTWPHKPGDKVQVLSGPFTGLNGIYQQPTAENRALILLELLGRTNTVEVELNALSA